MRGRATIDCICIARTLAMSAVLLDHWNDDQADF